MVNSQFQICDKNKANQIVELPNAANCDSATVENSTIKIIDLYVPLAMPKIFDAFLCYKKEVKVCTYSFTFFYSKIAERSEKYTLIEAGDCKLMSKQQHPSIEIFQLSSQLWGTEEAEKINYDFIGTIAKLQKTISLKLAKEAFIKEKL